MQSAPGVILTPNIITIPTHELIMLLKFYEAIVGLHVKAQH